MRPNLKIEEYFSELTRSILQQIFYEHRVLSESVVQIGHLFQMRNPNMIKERISNIFDLQLNNLRLELQTAMTSLIQSSFIKGLSEASKTPKKFLKLARKSYSLVRDQVAVELKQGLAGEDDIRLELELEEMILTSGNLFENMLVERKRDSFVQLQSELEDIDASSEKENQPLEPVKPLEQKNWEGNMNIERPEESEGLKERLKQHPIVKKLNPSFSNPEIESKISENPYGKIEPLEGIKEEEKRFEDDVSSLDTENRSENEPTTYKKISNNNKIFEHSLYHTQIKQCNNLPTHS